MPNDSPIIAAILARSSIRSYTGGEVPKQAVETLLRAAMAAPSARNVQPWCFMAVTARDIMEKLADALPNGQMLRSAPLALMVGADTAIAEAGTPGKDYWIQDCAAASQNILLAAEALGLGAVWLGVTPVEDRVENLRRILNLPDTVTPLNMIAVGQPREPGKAKDKFKPERIHWEKW